MLTTVLAAAALAAGLTGAWSPCGFSMVETLAPAGYAGRLRTTLVACATFTLGALVGGVITFGGLGLLGQWLGAGGTGAVAVAAVVAVAAAIGEARGVRIVPQVRRQVPESWRRVLPVPLAAGLYGVLLGLGFTTFILTFAVWALAAVSVALGDPQLGVILGLAFGAGRALPVIALAPVAESERGSAAHAAMAERPGILRGLRVADAVALAACAVAMTAVAPAQATTIAEFSASGPSAAGAYLTFQRPGPAGGRLPPRPEQHRRPAGRDPVLGAGLGRLAHAGEPDRARAAGHAGAGRDVHRPGRRPVRVQRLWVVWLVGQTQLVVQPRDASVAPRTVATARAGEQLGRPSIVGSALLFHRAGKNGSSIRLYDLAAGRESVVRSEKRALLEQPDVRRHARRLRALDLHAAGAPPRSDPPPRDVARPSPVPHHPHRAPRREPRARPPPPLGRLQGRKPPPLAPRPPKGVVDTLWTTALGPSAAYVTRLRKKSGVTTATILSVPRSGRRPRSAGRTSTAGIEEAGSSCCGGTKCHLDWLCGPIEMTFVRPLAV